MRGCSCRGTAGFAHVSCLAEQAKILVAEAEENNLHGKASERWVRWHTCSLCEQDYHGVVCCALGWACWKTYLGRAERDTTRFTAMNVLGNGLHEAERHEEALTVQEADLATRRRRGVSAKSMLAAQSNLACTYTAIGRLEEAMRMRRELYAGWSKFMGEDYKLTLVAANNYASSLSSLQRHEEAKSLMRKTMPVARRVLGENDEATLRARWVYAMALHLDPVATLDDLREAATTLEEMTGIARRVFGGAHPLVGDFESALRDSRTQLAWKRSIN